MLLFRKKQKAAPLSPAEAADKLRRDINDAIDHAERTHVGLPAIMTVLSQLTETLKYRDAGPRHRRLDAPGGAEERRPVCRQGLQAHVGAE
jgi:hypothetical protein